MFSNNYKYFLDEWEGRQVSITGYASNDEANVGQLQTASLKIDPFEKCTRTHEKKRFSGLDEASRTSLFKLSISLPRNFEPSLLCGRQNSANHGACPGSLIIVVKIHREADKIQ